MDKSGRFYTQVLGTPQKGRVVLLHGLMGSASNWRKVNDDLKTDFEVLVYDQRGHGRSFQPQTGYAPEDYADDLKFLLDELGWDQVHLIGHSMGGRNALNFSCRYPNRVQKLIIEDIGPDAQPRDQEKIRYLLDQVPVPFKGRKEAKEYMMNEFIWKIQDWYKPQILGMYLYSNLKTTDEGLIDWRFSYQGILETARLGRQKDRWDEIKSLKVPTLVIRGENSKELSRSVFEKMKNENNQVVGVEVPNVGHWIHMEEPEEFVHLVRDFIDET